MDRRSVLGALSELLQQFLRDGLMADVLPIVIVPQPRMPLL